ncbi:arginyltransferase [Rhodospirillum rubrum]|uniref:Aspartate/glutamate leucyltransferase n=1 Tax=Rhodospirillum rubrum (strain ATCC 11170 / ATH 1.1.1 / DSM 467 / LMG 4362 / NCIMB 8255 / S1) TaxID=269796 RepID=BPT_RHORT|nr:arginyltransferase [Rhodospirillum rubrum]Q2RTA0.1 RecName: Full=Aspartate/glutamate leucyltransferase [Rhodospirillum rubrum ATCC 11170]ABC22645.1 Arginyltransferase [Rhodospirillum rubrum ATCC 11170]AEO48363.1 arginyl-tRNA-protein transferase [Rhodospirillum rubrum F11]MBK5954242.1 arginyltransferase [Rhodospirillum rubrum]QXG82267.1 arginyltransferase [Rhodospirillum rubrum]HAQ00161.1 arginyltransferase [Rhodospirillum rubrum]
MDQGPINRPHFFFTTAPMPCPYLEGHLERKMVTDLTGPEAERLHESLSRAGFRRSHTIAYAPVCPGCTACVPVRIRARAFVKNKSFRRIVRANAGVTAEYVPARATVEQFHLFSQYQQARHGESDMALMGFFDYRSMVEDSPISTSIAEFREAGGELVAACLIDHLSDGLSAVYSFFNTTLPQSRGLGTWMILWMVDETVRRDLDHVYLGYWIAESSKMAYKERFQPLEVFGRRGWIAFDERGRPG